MKHVKRISTRGLALFMAFLMVFSLGNISSISVKAAPSVPYGYTTDENGIMAYSQKDGNRYDVQGCVNNAWRQVTYSYGGVRCGAYGGGSMGITCTPGFAAEGRVVVLTYTVTNNNPYERDYTFWVAADTMVNGNDSSKNTVNAERNMVTMTYNGVTFFGFSNSTDLTIIPTSYSGSYSYSTVRDGGDPRRTSVMSGTGDSAFVGYWPVHTLQPGQSAVYRLICGTTNNASIVEEVVEEINKTHTVAFETNGGSNVEGVSEVNELPNPLPTTMKEGFEFLGWYYDTACTQKANASDLISDDTVLYAGWKQIKKIISYNMGALESDAPSSTLADYGQNATIATPSYDNTKYEFLGWNTNAIGTGKMYQPGETVAMKEDIHLHAQWKFKYKVNVKAYYEGFNNATQSYSPVQEDTNHVAGTVDLTVNSGAVSGESAVYANASVSVSATPNTGYEFVGWYHTDNFANSGKYENTTHVVEQDTTYYALFKQKHVVVEFSKNAGGDVVITDANTSEKYYESGVSYTDVSHTAAIRVAYGTELNITANATDDNTHHVGSIYKVKGHEVEVVESVKDPHLLTVTTRTNALAVDAEYEITFLHNGYIEYNLDDATLSGDGFTADDTEMTVGATYTLPGTGNISKAGYTFIGWERFGKMYAPGATIEHFNSEHQAQYDAKNADGLYELGFYYDNDCETNGNCEAGQSDMGKGMVFIAEWEKNTADYPFWIEDNDGDEFGYATIDDAINAIKDKGYAKHVITLLDNAVITTNQTLPVGYTLTSEHEEDTITIAPGGSLTIGDNTASDKDSFTWMQEVNGAKVVDVKIIVNGGTIHVDGMKSTINTEIDLYPNNTVNFITDANTDNDVYVRLLDDSGNEVHATSPLWDGKNVATNTLNTSAPAGAQDGDTSSKDSGADVKDAFNRYAGLVKIVNEDSNGEILYGIKLDTDDNNNLKLVKAADIVAVCLPYDGELSYRDDSYLLEYMDLKSALDYSNASTDGTNDNKIYVVKNASWGEGAIVKGDSTNPTIKLIGAHLEERTVVYTKATSRIVDGTVTIAKDSQLILQNVSLIDTINLQSMESTMTPISLTSGDSSQLITCKLAVSSYNKPGTYTVIANAHTDISDQITLDIGSESAFKANGKELVASLQYNEEQHTMELVVEYGHYWEDEYTVDVAPTCENPGISSIHCKYCDEKKGVINSPAPLEHQFKAVKAFKAEGNKLIGTETVTCDREGCDFEKVISAELTLSVKAPSYTGSTPTVIVGTEEEQELFKQYFGNNSIPKYTFYKGDTALSAAPITLGDYTVKISPVGETANAENTATHSFSIVKSPDEIAFDQYKQAKIDELNNKRKDDDSAATKKLFDDAIAEIEAVTYDYDLDLNENKAKIDAIEVKVLEKVINQRADDKKQSDKERFEEYRKMSIDIAGLLGRDDDSDAAKDLIEDAIRALKNYQYDENKPVADQEKALDAIIEKLKKNLNDLREKEAKELADREAFEQYKKDKKAEIEKFRKDDDSDAVKALIDEALAQIDATDYDPSMTRDENEDVIDGIEMKLLEDLANQRAKDKHYSDRRMFEDYREMEKVIAKAFLRDGDSDEAKALVAKALADLDAYEYNPDKTLEENEKALHDINVKLEQDLEALRIKENNHKEFEKHKVSTESKMDGLRTSDDSETVKKLIDDAIAAVKALTYDEAKSKEENLAAIDAIYDKLVKDITKQRAVEAQEKADNDAFEAYKKEKIEHINSLRQDDDSEAAKKLIDDAIAAIKATTYDPSKSKDLNEDVIDDIELDLLEKLADQRAKDKHLSDLERYNLYKEAEKYAAEEYGHEGDSDAAKELIKKAIEDLTNHTYDPNKSVEENEKELHDIVKKLESDLDALRAKEKADADKKQFEDYKAEKIAELQELLKDENLSDEMKKLIEDAIKELEKLSYDDDKDVLDNIDNIDDIMNKFNEDYANQKNKEEQAKNDRDAFNEHKEAVKKQIEALGQDGDSDAAKKLIADALATLEKLGYDDAKTRSENKAAIDQILEDLKKALDDQRKADKDANDKKLADAKQEAKDALDKLLGDNPSEALKKIVADAKKAIDGSLSVEDVNKALEDAKKAIAAQKELEAAQKELDAAKKAAKAELDALLGDNPSEELKKLVEDAKKAIDGSKTLADVSKNLQDAKNKIAALKNGGNKDDKPASKQEKLTNSLQLSGGLKVSESTNGREIHVEWGEVKDADGYAVYAQYCGKKHSKTPVKTVKGSENTKFTLKKLNGKKLDTKKNYKLCVVAYKEVDGKKVTIGKTMQAHVVGAKNQNYTNVKHIKLNSKSQLTLSVGKTSKVKAKSILVEPGKKELSDKHAKEFRYISSDKAVATVTSKGKIKAVGKGNCTVFVFARNGYARKVKVTVK